MPHITVTTSKVLTPEIRDDIAAALGKLITLLPGKSEPVLMIDIADGRNMYFGGEKKPCIYANVALYHASPAGDEKNFAAEMTAMLTEKTGVPAKDIYLTFTEFPTWCSGGVLK